MMPLPPISLSAGPAIGGTAGGPSEMTSGSWTVNVGGSGLATQAASGGLSPLMLGAIAIGIVGALWLLMRD